METYKVEGVKRLIVDRKVPRGFLVLDLEDKDGGQVTGYVRVELANEIGLVPLELQEAQSEPEVPGEGTEE